MFSFGFVFFPIGSKLPGVFFYVIALYFFVPSLFCLSYCLLAGFLFAHRVWLCFLLHLNFKLPAVFSCLIPPSDFFFTVLIFWP